ncbi:hypothetical protein MnTg04_01193 [bacterium MnTg04]|nr:hypothetical protein MnTg04_01193 [bacterium MnTg04]
MSRGPVTVLAFDFDGASNFAVDMPVTVIVLGEMTVDTVHTLVEVHRRQMHGFLKFLRIVIGDDMAVGIEEPAGLVAFLNRSEIPAMTVIIGELGVL